MCSMCLNSLSKLRWTSRVFSATSIRLYAILTDCVSTSVQFDDASVAFEARPPRQHLGPGGSFRRFRVAVVRCGRRRRHRLVTSLALRITPRDAHTTSTSSVKATGSDGRLLSIMTRAAFHCLNTGTPAGKVWDKLRPENGSSATVKVATTIRPVRPLLR